MIQNQTILDLPECRSVRRIWFAKRLKIDPQNDSEIKYKLDIDSFILKENPNLAIGKVNPLPH